MASHTNERMRASDWVTLIIISIIVSTCGVLGVSYVMGAGRASFNLTETLVYIGIFTVVAGVVFFLMDLLFNWVCKTRYCEGATSTADAKAAKHRTGTVLSRITPRWSAKSIIVFCLVMAVFWAPWLIANYPGGTYWDTYYQIYQVYPENHPIAVIPWEEIYNQTLTDAWLVDHHPVLVTLIYGAFGWVSDQLTGNWMAGVFLFCLLQGIAHIVAFTCAVAYLRRRNCPIVLCFCAYAFFCIMPFISTWAMCMVKDSLFGLLCVPYFIMLFEAVRTHGKSLSRARSIVVFVLLGLFMCLTRKNGIFIVVPTAIFAAATLTRRHGAAFAQSGAVKACLIQIGTCVVTMGLVLPFVVFPAANIQAGGTQEILGSLFQQTARYLSDYGDEITVTEKRAIGRVLDYDEIADSYQYNFADSVKYRYNLDATPQDILEYLKAWATQGARHPDSYLAAAASLAGYYVAPTAYANIRMVTVDTYMGTPERHVLYNPPELDEFRKTLDDSYKAVAETPGIDLPLLIVVYAFWLPAGLLYTTRRRRMRCKTLLVPAIVMLLFCMISPVYDARYCVPIFDMAPLLVCAIAALRVKQLGRDGSANSADAHAAHEIEMRKFNTSEFRGPTEINDSALGNASYKPSPMDEAASAPQTNMPNIPRKKPKRKPSTQKPFEVRPFFTEGIGSEIENDAQTAEEKKPAIYSRHTPYGQKFGPKFELESEGARTPDIASRVELEPSPTPHNEFAPDPKPRWQPERTPNLRIARAKLPDFSVREGFWPKEPKIPQFARGRVYNSDQTELPELRKAR